MKALHAVTLVLLIVGGLNWGLVGLAGFDLVAEISGSEFGFLNPFSRIVFILVGLAALAEVFFWAASRSHHLHESKPHHAAHA